MSKEISEKKIRLPGRRLEKLKPGQQPVVQCDKSGNFIRRYESAKDASRITNTDHSHILDCCNEKPYRHTAGGYVWKFERSDDLSQSQS